MSPLAWNSLLNANVLDLAMMVLSRSKNAAVGRATGLMARSLRRRKVLAGPDDVSAPRRGGAGRGVRRRRRRRRWADPAAGARPRAARCEPRAGARDQQARLDLRYVGQLGHLLPPGPTRCRNVRAADGLRVPRLAGWRTARHAH